MKLSSTRSLTTLLASLTILSFVCLDANAQLQLGQNWFGEAHSRSGSNVQSLYDSNSQGPLGGLFAPGFTRTMTILGGLNFPSAGFAENFDSEFNASLDGGGSQDGIEELDETGYAISFAFGRRHSNRLRSEIEIAIRGNDINSTVNTFIPSAGINRTEEATVGNVEAISLMKNFIIDFDNNSRFTPYVGAGLGLSYVEVELEDTFPPLQAGETLFSYQAIGGVATRLSSVADFIVEYRFLGTSEVEFDDLGTDLTYNTSNLFFGVKLEY